MTYFLVVGVLGLSSWFGYHNYGEGCSTKR